MPLPILMDFVSLAHGTQDASLSNATYSCALNNTWTGNRHPNGYAVIQNVAHWTSPVLVAHSDSYELWTPYQFASPGVENVAEIGATFLLEKELEASREDGVVGDFVVGNDQFNAFDPPQTFADLHMTPEFRWLSSISMIAPSPDWFSGISGVAPVSASGYWFDSFAISTGPWDAGTEQGETYSIDNPPEAQQRPITPLTFKTVPSSGILLDPTRTTVLPVATWSCVLRPTVTADELTTVIGGNSTGNSTDSCLLFLEKCDDGDECCSGSCIQGTCGVPLRSDSFRISNQSGSGIGGAAGRVSRNGNGGKVLRQLDADADVEAAGCDDVLDGNGVGAGRLRGSQRLEYNHKNNRDTLTSFV